MEKNLTSINDEQTTSRGRVLVTGATGFLGRRTVEMLLERGFQVRALVRSPSKIGNLSHLGAEIAPGDVTNPATLEPAVSNIDYVIHAAADTSNTEEGARKVTIGGTRNILELCASHPVKKLVYVSSCSVYGVADFQDGQVIDEGAPLERFPERRGIYSWAKLEAEKIVAEFMKREKLPVVCLRPGTIYGSGGENYTPMVGFSIGEKIYIVIDHQDFVLPLVYVDNLVEAIVLALLSEQSAGQVYTVVDPQQVDKRRYMDGFIRKLHPGAWYFYLPLGLLSGLVAVQEKTLALLGRKPILSRYRLISSQKPVVYDASKIMHDLGWQAQISFEAAVAQIIDRAKDAAGRS